VIDDRVLEYLQETSERNPGQMNFAKRILYIGVLLGGVAFGYILRMSAERPVQQDYQQQQTFSLERISQKNPRIIIVLPRANQDDMQIQEPSEFERYYKSLPYNQFKGKRQGVPI